MAYTTNAKVSDELGGYTLDAASTPSSSVITTWIADAAAEIDSKTNMTFESTATTDICDYDGSKRVILENKPVLDISKVFYNKEPIGNAAEWEELTEDTDWVSYNSFNLFQFVTAIGSGKKKLKVEYTYGETTVPLNVAQLAAKLVAKRVILSIQTNSQTTEGGSISVGPISINDPSRFSLDYLERLNTEIADLYSTVGTLRTFQYNKLWD